jgi:extracellular elastinolytic metalloproteinase
LNHYHDHLMDAPISFTDAAGNFEFGGTGGNDMVLGNTSDGANTDHGFPDLNHVDNANMSTFPDGTPPIMQMYLFKKLPRFGLPTIPSANGGDDAEVVYHEYTHGLSNRLVVYPDGNSGLDNQQAGSMGEAWSDWYAEDFLNNEGYKPDTAAEGLVVMGQLTFAGVLRSQPVDCPANDNSSGRCPGGFDTSAGGYTYGDFGHITSFDGVHPAPEVHADGEIWLEALWDLRMALDTNGFTDGGSDNAEELITRAMELSPPSPSFLDMRNAILQADVVANGGANEDTIWQVFADRGLGYFASSVGGGDTSPVEDFSTPPDCGVDPCHDVSGTVTDKDTGDPIEGGTVGFSGLMSGFGFDLSDTTDVNGDYLVQDVPDHTYADWVFSADGYETGVTQALAVGGADVVANKKLNRDWAALSAGAVLKKFTPPDYADFCGANANGAFDLNVGSGWPSDSVDVDPEIGVPGPKRAVVRLPDHIDISSFGVASGGTCGDDSTAGFKHFQIQTRTSKDAPWRTAVDAKAKSDGVLHTFKGSSGLNNVQTIRFVMLSNHGDPFFMDALEVTVRGEPH